MTASIPLSLYIHIPWCEKKCPYCDFNSHLAKTEINEPAYINALLDDLSKDLSRFKAQVADRELSSIFICLLYTSPSPRDGLLSRMPSSA